ncbi:hypothetical protein AAEP93_010103 [Penicillium crustosum]
MAKGQEPQELPTESVQPLDVKNTASIDKKEVDSFDESQYDFDSAEFKDIPELVRTVVGFEDDPSLPVLTFRSILLSAVFCTIGSIVSQLSYFRTTYAPFPVFFVILASDPLGRFMARVLPAYRVPLGRFSFSLNPGPWSTKEHAIVGIAANAGSQGQWATFLPTNAALYYNITMNPAVALFFGWGCSLLGFAFAAMVRGVLIDDPEFIFPLSLQQVTLYRSMDAKNRPDQTRAREQVKVFWILLLATFVWQFLPEYLFPFVASLAPLCWFASRNHTVNFIGAGRGVYLDSNGMQHINETKYDEVGLAYSGAQYTWQMFMWVASYMSSFAWCGLFLGPKIYRMWKARNQSGAYHQDRLSRIIHRYPSITKWEWVPLTLVPTLMLLGVVVSKTIYMPIWTYFVALGFGAVSMLPMSFVYAISGFSIKVGYFNELIYGYMIDVKGSSRHPLGQLAYRIISGNVWYDARIVLEDQKIGHYLHLPPRQVIGIQVIANMLALPINYGVMRWVIATKFDYVSGKKKDPLGQWTGQDFQSYNTAGIQYALVGPRKLFASDFFRPILWGFLAGALAPFVIWLLHKKFPRARFDLWNTTIFFASAAVFYGNLSTGPFTTFLVGTFTNFFLYRYRRVFWNKWAYISGAALDTGFNANLLFIFIFLGTTGAKMIHWWGNNADSVERCFALN